MRKAADYTLHEFSTLHTGKATPAMVEGVMVEAYGSNMRLKEVAAITTPDARTIAIQPWDKGLAKPIERSILMANIGLTPSINGDIVRCPIPELSRERRTELGKVAHGMAEEGRIRIRQVRREALDVLKKSQKEGLISEDDQKRLEKEIQQITDRFIAEIGTHLSQKEDELLKV